MKNRVLNRISAILIIVTMLVTSFLCGCGKDKGKGDPNLGLYIAKYGSMNGIELSVDDVFGQGFTIELKDKNKCEVFVDGDKASGKWSLDGDKFEFSAGGIECSGTLENGVIALNDVMGTGVDFTLINEDYKGTDSKQTDGKSDNEEKSGSGPSSFKTGSEALASDDMFLSAEDKKWSGTWYGVISFDECTGAFEEQNECFYPVYMVVEFTVEDGGVFTIYDEDEKFAEADFLIINDAITAVDGTAFDQPMNANNYTFLSARTVENRIVMYDTIKGSSGTLDYTMTFKPWGVRWDESEGLVYFDDIIAPYYKALDANEEPKFGWANPVYSANGAGNAGDSPSLPGGMSGNSDDNDDVGSDSSANSAGMSVDPNAVDAKDYVIVDNDKFKVVATGKGVFEYNEEWIGYTLHLENKTDTTLGFCSTSEEYALDEEDIFKIKNDTCYYNGVLTDTHFKKMLNAGASDDKSVLAIDGVTDVSQVENMKGYIKVWDNDSDETFGYYPYSFK